MGKHLDKYLKVTASGIEQRLKDIIEKEHKGSGELLKSIHVKIELGIIHIQANDYIKYLDEGKFLKDFLKKETEKIKKELPKEIKKDIIEKIKTKK